MPFCPRCRYEYNPSIRVCPDCGVDLVSELPSMVSAAVTLDDSWVVAGMVSSQIKSELAKGALDFNNIPSMIVSSSFSAHGKGLDFISGLGQSGSIGNVILVPREFDIESAIILEAVLGEDFITPND
ncbi:MAG: hypothetical protein DRP47_08085 [Candidatus Zixiibacteriota bacterium]|nr:MAG: hypothetical protein DRP47_08085 [candidate division Zixibacteria bacterium]